LNAVRAQSRWHTDVIKILEGIQGSPQSASSFFSRFSSHLTGNKIRLPKEDWWKLAEILGCIEAQMNLSGGISPNLAEDVSGNDTTGTEIL